MIQKFLQDYLMFLQNWTKHYHLQNLVGKQYTKRRKI